MKERVRTQVLVSRSRWLLIAGCLIAATAAAALALLHQAPTKAVAGAVQNPLVATAPGWVDVEGGIQRLGIRTEGTVQSLMVHEGQSVAAGDLLLKLDDGPTMLELRAAAIDIQRRHAEQIALAAQLTRLRAEITRLTPLVAAQAESADELRGASARLADLQSQITLADLAEHAAQLQTLQLQQRLKRGELRAPAAGEILRVSTHVGDTVAPGSALLSFVGNGPRIVRAELDERLFGQVTSGMTAEVAPEYDDMKLYEARVLRVAHAVGPVQTLPELRAAAKDDRVVECVLSVDNNDLLIGQRVLVRFRGSH
ncbi:MAG: secretion protein HlyD family protein [Hydrocarboniphaga sp.]|uniref:efflux RND transporter periplasmic adaptor subunit n=1 Tax=Hydrocarboniphaga sp. TaxID=2033016 RepID=UPI002614062C|nr:HlyD family efflux transporter periplasmic adaptor subunit [Hydrocarboniphaga sp.]MDB5972573.1 secretion protein HlyD family protein [Hydrocarboniphaga sp.]